MIWQSWKLSHLQFGEGSFQFWWQFRTQNAVWPSGLPFSQSFCNFGFHFSWFCGFFALRALKVAPLISLPPLLAEKQDENCCNLHFREQKENKINKSFRKITISANESKKSWQIASFCGKSNVSSADNCIFHPGSLFSGILILISMLHYFIDRVMCVCTVALEHTAWNKTPFSNTVWNTAWNKATFVIPGLF